MSLTAAGWWTVSAIVRVLTERGDELVRTDGVGAASFAAKRRPATWVEVLYVPVSDSVKLNPV